ncbi:DUF4317 domain-containing protein [Ruminococcus sp. NK3A76]|uniref:DUF4317 domain-containing protein n=1 Tax=Ruminococcus sp. NK3A76 TaxID=877411 RepID=UPI00048CE0E1|nr:DUF4317 domain-containing protein [Ruminococcus sp. NK3A76]
MNKKEINELKKNFSDDCGYFTISNVVSAFVDSEKNIKYKSVDLYSTLSQDESEQIILNLKKVLSGQLGKNLNEFAFPQSSYAEGGAQKLLYDNMMAKFKDETLIDAFLQRITEKVAYVSTYAIFSAHCTYSVFAKNKNDELTEESEMNYNFLITAISPVNTRFDGLIYDDESNSIIKKATADKIVELPTDGFLFPVFSDRMPDVNAVMVYSKNAKKPNASVVQDMLDCEFQFSSEGEKTVFKALINNVVGEELDYEIVTKVNEKIQDFAAQNANDTEIPKIDERRLNTILWEAGVSQENLEKLPQAYEKAMEKKPFTAYNLIEKKTTITMPSVTVNVKKEAVDKVRTQMVDGKRCIVIALDDAAVEINGIPANID